MLNLRGQCRDIGTRTIHLIDRVIQAERAREKSTPDPEIAKPRQLSNLVVLNWSYRNSTQ
jgi:hypothetical protein